MDLEFAIQCVLISTMKIYNVGSDINETEITAIVRGSFPDGIRVTLPQVLKWSALTEEVKLFFSTIFCQNLCLIIFFQVSAKITFCLSKS